ncbi:HECT-like Ubiquitin-conjugating enzyme (E2)-binding [Ceratobasidium sp. AG-Ba]|nr:HECT-like Ubiquitin-conjugating enzyme (E2)-binding [Ceratobasidium sp. AG-Ba]
MATLTRIQNLISSRRTSPAPQPAVLDNVPTPFPSLRDRHHQTGEDLHPDDARLAPNRMKNLPPTPSLTVEFVDHAPETPRDAEILPSLISVEQSCLMALNNLFAGVIPNEHWRPIVPPRRHSLPSLVASASQALSLSDSTPLYTLVSNLRLQNPSDVMIQASDNDADLLRELSQHVERYSELMGEKDARLARLLVTLLQFSGKLSAMAPASSSLSPPGLTPSASQPISSNDVYDTLSRQASSIQLQLHDSRSQGRSVSAAEQAMLWAQVDHVLGDIHTLCHDRALPTPFLSPYQSDAYDRNLPPEYEQGDYHEAHPPVYETPLQPYSDMAPEKEKSLDTQSVLQRASSHRESIVSSEKMKLDLDSVMMAIDRLYMVAPQLNSQRVELKGRKLEQMEFARVAGAIEKLVDSGRLDDQRAVYRPNSKGKQRLEDKQDLENLMSMIGQAASRTLDSQTVFVDNMQARLARAKQKDDAKRDAFVTQLAQHSSHGRMHSQDATMRTLPRERSTVNRSELDVRASLSTDEPDVADPNMLMTLPEFVKSHPGPNRKSPPLAPVAGASHPGTPRILKKSSKLGLNQGRSRSNSAPPLAWLTGKSATGRSPLAEQALPPNAQMGVAYVAEHRESLHMVSLQLRLDGLPRSAKLEGEVVSGPDGSTLVLQCGSTSLSPLALPAQVTPGKVDLCAASMGRPNATSDYFDLKLTTTANVTEALDHHPHDSVPLLDAAQLQSSHPSSFVCASCSLPVVVNSAHARYTDLPSEHWAELLDAWMCHPDQTVSAELAKRAGGDGFWPEAGQILVGGGYLLFDESTVNRGGLVDDPNQAHASYRFVVQDEESGGSRILLWLFKPSIQLSYAGAAGSVIPACGTITAAKVTFVIFGPGESANSMERYPAFRNAEILTYPMDLCRRLAASLKESNAVYPEARRTLDGMSLGWLQRG